MNKALGFIGLGNMGDPFCRHLLAAGYEVHIREIRQEVAEGFVSKGAQLHESNRSLADGVETVFLSLPTPDIVKSVVTGEDGLIHGSRVKRVVDLSTTGPDAASEVASALNRADISYIDAPVSGGVAGATAGKSVIMLACNDDEKAAVADMLDLLGTVYHVGKQPGLGQMIKILNNMLSAGSLIIASEVAAMGVKAGLNPGVMIDVFNAGSGRSSATLDKYAKAILPGTFSTGFTARLMFKDLSLCLDLAQKLGLEMPASLAVQEEWRRAMTEVGAEADFSRIVLMRERAAGVEVRE